MLFHFDRRKKSEKEKKPPRFLVLRRKWLTLGAAVLAALDGETYQDAADTLAVKAKRARERKEEQLRHEKNLRQGKKRVHGEAAPQLETPTATPPARPVEKRPSRPNSAKRRQDRPKRRTEPPGQRFAGSLPVKKGKGSRKKTGK